MELAERRGIALSEARALVVGVDLRQPGAAPQTAPEPPVTQPDSQRAATAGLDPQQAADAHAEPGEPSAAGPAGRDAGAESVEPESVAMDDQPPSMTLAEQAQAELAAAGVLDADGSPQDDAPEPQHGEEGEEPRGDHDFDYETGQGFEPAAAPSAAGAADVDRDVREVLENGIRDISGEVRNSLDFHRSQDGGGEVAHVVLSGAAEEIPGFAELLAQSLGVEVHGESVVLADSRLQASVSQHRLAIAAGLATTEAPQ
jgi:hypothetical protein